MAATSKYLPGNPPSKNRPPPSSTTNFHGIFQLLKVQMVTQFIQYHIVPLREGQTLYTTDLAAHANYGACVMLELALSSSINAHKFCRKLQINEALLYADLISFIQGNYIQNLIWVGS